MAKRWTLVAFLAALSFVAGHGHAAPFETKAKQAFMIDATSGTILFSKNADDLIPPASLAKLMTMETVFHAVKEGKVSLNQEYVVSEHAWRTGGAPSGGSTMFAKLKSSIRLEDLIRGVIIQSANDGAIILAEGMAGSEENSPAR
jgi:D-alanyl-D-alanine carboxypeptidase (penicillin-binding protein 5/6)